MDSRKLSPTRGRGSGLNVFYEGEVTEVGTNPLDDSVIRTRIASIDKGGDNLGEWSLPLLPVKFFHALPQKGDKVYVQFKEVMDDEDIQKGVKRFWMGPIESNWEDVGKVNFLGKSRLDPDSADGLTTKKNINLDKSKQGVYPTIDEVAMHKGNTDIILSDNISNPNPQILLRAGKFIFGDNTRSKFNNNNPGIINIKYGSSNIREDEETEIKTKIEYVDPEYTIYVEIRELSGAKLFGYIRVTKISDNTIDAETEEEDSQGNATNFVVSNTKRNMLVLRIKQHLITYIQGRIKYNKWSFISSEKEFKNDKKFFPGYRTERKETVIKKPKSITSGDGGGSVINIMSNRINLYSYDGINKNNKLLNSNKQIDEDEQRNINKQLQSIVYGERLVEFLRLVKTYVTTHIHPFHGMPPIQDNSVIEITKYNLDKVLNKNIKTN